MWSLIRTRHKREPLGVSGADLRYREARAYNEVDIRTLSSNLSDPTSSVVKVDDFNGSYTNETLECRIFSAGSVRESAFVDCNFPELVSLVIDRPCRLSFVRCRFQKLRSIRITGGEEVFYSCFFARINRDDVDRALFSNCELKGVPPEYAFLYEGTSELDW